MAKRVLRGGPWDGKIHDRKFGSFGVGYVFEVFDKEDNFLGRSPNFFYSSQGISDYERHPCKKKGTTQVWRYELRMDDAIIPDKIEDRKLLRPKEYGKMTKEEQKELDKALGIV